MTLMKLTPMLTGTRPFKPLAGGVKIRSESHTGIVSDGDSLASMTRPLKAYTVSCTLLNAKTACRVESIDSGVALAEALSVTFDHNAFCNTCAPK